MKSTIIGVLLAIVVLVGLTAFAIFYFSDRWNEPDLGNEVLVEAEEIPVEEIPAEEVPVEEAPTEKTPVEETPVEEIPAEKTPVEDPNSHLSLIYFRNNPVTKYSIEQPEGYDLTIINPAGHVKSVIDRVLTIKANGGKLSVYIAPEVLIVESADGEKVEVGPHLSPYWKKTYYWWNVKKIALEDLELGDFVQLWMMVMPDQSIGIVRVHKIIR